MGKRKVGRRGLPLKDVQQLERALAAGQNRQAILQSSGVSAKSLRKAQQQALPAQRQKHAYARCELCGVWVKLPCIACKVKRWQRLWSVAKQLRAKRSRAKKEGSA
jgi:hypothetical protein